MKHQIKGATQTQEGHDFTDTVHISFAKIASQGMGLDYIYIYIYISMCVCARFVTVHDKQQQKFPLQISAIK
jgi:hypothetical protein